MAHVRGVFSTEEPLPPLLAIANIRHDVVTACREALHIEVGVVRRVIIAHAICTTPPGTR